ncbi:MAG: DUF4116 domain-containing protein, partial [Lachnospiraceae bacterium]|nr:DUF4116 domain-containing protein [Lachnospiraceae bacterium]
MIDNKLEIELGLKELSPIERVYNNPTKFNLKGIPKINQTSELVEFVISHDGMALKQISKKLITIELCKKAVSQNGLALEYVPEKYVSEEICNIAVNRNGRAIEFVPQNMITKDMVKNAVTFYLGRTLVEGERLSEWNKYPIAYIPMAL